MIDSFCDKDAYFPSLTLKIFCLHAMYNSHEFFIKRMATMNDNLAADIH